MSDGAVATEGRPATKPPDEHTEVVFPGAAGRSDARADSRRDDGLDGDDSDDHVQRDELDELDELDEAESEAKAAAVDAELEALKRKLSAT